MHKRTGSDPSAEVSGDITGHLAPLVETDEYLDALAAGSVPGDGEGPRDDLAEALLELRAEVHAPLPPAPVIEGAAEEADPQVISLPAARSGRGRANPWLAGLVGAAAATLVVAGSGVAIHAAGPGSPLYGVRGALYGTGETQVVELAGTLEEAESRAADGDMAGMRELVNQALRQLDAPAPRERGGSAPATRTVTESAPAPAPSSAAEPEPSVTTVYVDAPTVTVYATTTVTPDGSDPSSVAPSESEPVATQAPTPGGENSAPDAAPSLDEGTASGGNSASTNG